MDINEIIRQSIQEHNDLLEKAATITKKQIHPPFSIEDYDYLKESLLYFGEFALPYFLSYAACKDAEYRIKNPYAHSIWYFKNDVDKHKTKDFLSIQSRLLFDTLTSYMSLLKSKNYLQALIIFRSYIEYSSQFYACLLDYDFFKKYTENESLDEEYRKHWFKNLKPEKVLSKIRQLEAEIKKLTEKQTDVYTLGQRIWMAPFDSGLRGVLYDDLSGLAHGSYPALVKNDELQLEALVFLCSAYLMQSQMVIDEVSSPYFKYSQDELFKKWTTMNIYIESRKPNAILYVG